MSIKDPENHSIELNCELRNKISIYRLVDKFLWLSNKIRMIGDKQNTYTIILSELRGNQYKKFFDKYKI